MMAENVVDKAFEEQKVQVVTIRPRAIFGPFDRAILPRLLQAEKNGVLTIIGTGENVIDITYVDNVAESLVLAAKAEDKVLGKKYNITNDEPLPLKTILEILYRQLDKPLQIKTVSYPLAKKLAYVLEKVYQTGLIAGEPVLTPYKAAVLALGQTLNIDAAKQDLHYKPKISIEEGIQQFVTWYRKS